MKNNNWFKDAIVYQIFIDRFAGFNEKNKNNWNKPEFVGGNIKGIIEKLPYLEKLGINTIWLSPFYKCTAYHGYHITDFFKIDKRFGTLDDLKKLIYESHKIGIKIIADFVPNHCSNEHPFFKEAEKNKNSEYYKWFYFTKWPEDYLCYLSVKVLPKINLEYAPARKHIIDSAKYWLSLGIDGYRLDHAIGPKHSFWIEFRKQIKKDFPEAVLIGEICVTGIKPHQINTINIKNKDLEKIKKDIDIVFEEYRDELEGVLDFRFKTLIDEFNENKITKKQLFIFLKKHYSNFNSFYLPTFLDNHDVDRILFKCKNNIDKMKELVEIQFSINQPIVIYCGSEIGMTQEKSKYDFKEYGDLQARQTMIWEEKSQNKELLNFYKKLITERKNKINKNTKVK